MRRTTGLWLRAAAVTAMALTIGCDGPSPVSIGAYPRVATETTCQLLIECCESATRWANTISECEERMLPAFEGIIESYQPSIDAVRVQWDESAAGECLAVTTCPSTYLTERCTSLWIPLVSDGGECTSAAECISGFCDSTTLTCAPRHGEGEPCTWSSCATGSYCDLAGSMTCLPKLEIGAPCSSPVQCGSRSCNGGVCGAAASDFCPP